MKLSHSLKKDVMLAAPGSIRNKFILKSRRTVLFFEDIFADYVKECESAGYEKEINNLGYRWGLLCGDRLFPNFLKLLPVSACFNIFIKKVWTNIGIVDTLRMSSSGNKITLATENESVTRSAGKNLFMPNFYRGVITGVTGKNAILQSREQDKGRCSYEFLLTEERVTTNGKEKSEYNRLNSMEAIEGFTLKDAIRKGVFHVDSRNGVYFRSKKLSFAETTIFHLIGNSELNLDSVSKIAYRYFSDVIEKTGDRERKLNLLRIVLQSMGWGYVKIVDEGKNIFVYIRNPRTACSRRKTTGNFFPGQWKATSC